MDDQIRLQPLVTLDDNSIYGYEALYTKSDFAEFPSATHILRSVAMGCCGKREGRHDFKIFINMTIEDVADENFCREFLGAMEEVGFAGNAIVLELNENTNPEFLLHMKKSFSLLRRHNIKIALDDFGTQYSSIEYMGELPVDIVKLDKKFTQNAPSNRKIRSLIKFCSALSHDIGCDVVAEGIETIDHLECAMEAQIDIGQGFLFPAPAMTIKTKKTPFINIRDFASMISAPQPMQQRVAI
ncbi:MAG: EAL domain-containing protein [Holosporaceae bacterium]|jgi:EAL domain-containing protein (putative c-di-GMP-specific phosphodiesterase class I)|nr:EAL domain-containing protein [Holosporaceae bacterium]